MLKDRWRGLIEQQPGRRDRRQRLLRLTRPARLHAQLLTDSAAASPAPSARRDPKRSPASARCAAGLIAEDERGGCLG